MATGIVRFYNAVKGFGLIVPDLGGPAIFANAADLKFGLKKLSPRDRVQFDVREGAAGTSAANISVLAG